MSVGRRVFPLTALLCAAVLLTAPPARCAAPRKLDIPAFSVTVTDGSGTPKKYYSQTSPPYLDLDFVLALSSSSRYSTSITLFQFVDGKAEEKVVFQGPLEEGVYHLTEPLPLPSRNGEIGLKIVLKTRFFPKKFTGESFYVYRQWEGSYFYGGTP